MVLTRRRETVELRTWGLRIIKNIVHNTMELEILLETVVQNNLFKKESLPLYLSQ